MLVEPLKGTTLTEEMGLNRLEWRKRFL